MNLKLFQELAKAATIMLSNREGNRKLKMAGKIIAVTNQKGGVGKTTTAVNLAHYLAKGGKSVLLVDFDPQGNATSGLGVDKRQLRYTVIDAMEHKASLSDCVVDSGQKRLYLLPTIPQMANYEAELANKQQKFTRLKQALSSHSYDVVVIDCPPSLSLLTVNALIAADHLLLPVQAEFYALEGLGQLLETMQLVKKGLNPELNLLGVVVTMVDSRTTLSAQVQAEVQKHFPDKVFKTVIPRNIRLAEAPSHGLPVGVYDRWSKGARAYKTLAKEVLSRV